MKIEFNHWFKKPDDNKNPTKYMYSFGFGINYIHDEYLKELAITFMFWSITITFHSNYS